MTDATFTFWMDEALKNEFADAVKSRDRAGAQLLRDFVRQQQEAAEHDAWFRRQVQIGQDSANAGNPIPGGQVEATFAARLVLTRRRLDTK